MNNISTNSLSSTVQQVGSYTIPVAGKYQVRLMGEMGYNGGIAAGAGGILVANKQFSGKESLIIKAIKGGAASDGTKGGAGVGLWENGNVVLIAGGGSWAWNGGGGYTGGGANGCGGARGYSWDGSVGSNTNYCSSASCDIGAIGGRWWWVDRNCYGYGGTGYCSGGYACSTTTGGNADRYKGGWIQEAYSFRSHGNHNETNASTGGRGYAAIVYCGPNSNSSCP